MDDRQNCLPLALRDSATLRSSRSQSYRFVIVGAGLAGSLMAIHLAARGHQVEVYERRPDPRMPGAVDHGRSINLGLSQRGVRALDGVGLLDAVMPYTVPMRGRVIHRRDGGQTFQPYGTRDDQILHSIRRTDLSAVLIERAESYPSVRFCFDTAFTRLDADKPVVYVTDPDGAELRVTADAVIGADGVFSAVRQQMQHGERADYAQEFLPWGYKEVTIPAASPLEALHVWPGDRGLIVAHPNQDGSLTGTVFLPLDGPHSLATLREPEQIRAFFAAEFPDTLELMPDLVAEFRRNPTGTLVTIRTAPWHRRDQVVLVGDAAHAVYPFYGQGMNAAFEDCAVLDDCLGEHPTDLGAAFAAYQQRRKRHTDVLATLSTENFVDLRRRVRSPLHRARRRADLALNRLFPDSWVPLYTMVSHTSMPYADAMARARRQDTALTWLGLGAVAAVAALSTYGARRRSGRGR
ncbi:MAG TPA: NAD(P)/FAD-dependent oxidoreductase [Pilimelia sp.]|nr:NAD(P)/FAD-dependent oxidoreductase [Pilimelia sp.]